MEKRERSAEGEEKNPRASCTTMERRKGVVSEGEIRLRQRVGTSQLQIETTGRTQRLSDPRRFNWQVTAH